MSAAGHDVHLLERLSALYPAVVADCLDRLGYRRQVMEPHIRPLFPEAKLAGYAVTVHCIEVDTPPANPRGATSPGERRPPLTPVGAVTRGFVAGAAGTLASGTAIRARGGLV